MISWQWYHITKLWYHIPMISYSYDIIGTLHMKSIYDIIVMLYDVICQSYHRYISYEKLAWYHISSLMISFVHDIIFTVYDIMPSISLMISYIILVYHALISCVLSIRSAIWGPVCVSYDCCVIRRLNHDNCLLVVRGSVANHLLASKGSVLQRHRPILGRDWKD